MSGADRLKFHSDGAELVRAIVSGPELGRLRRAMDSKTVLSAGRPGRRNFFPTGPVSRIIAADGAMGSLAAELCGSPCRAVRIIMFDKSAETNWAVGWHQDRTIAVKQAVDAAAAGYAVWTKKNGVCHVEPPERLLANMVTLRLHLDDCGADNGALQILPGTHRLGRISSKQAVRLGRQQALNPDGSLPAETCAAAAGDVLAMRLLTVHASARSENPSRRRVLHVDYSPDDLPAPLQWAI